MHSSLLSSRKAVIHAWNSRLVRDIALVASGTAGAQAITMAFSPLITRIYSPDAFGLLGTYTALLAILTPIAALAYPIAIVLPQDEREALALVRLSTILSFFIAILACIFLTLGGGWLSTLLGAESIANYLFLIPLAMLFAAFVQVAQQWLIRKKEFGVIARTALVQAVILNCAKTGVGWFHPFGAVLIVLATLGHVLQAVLLFLGAKWRYEPSTSSHDQKPQQSLRELLYRYRDFPLYRAPQNFINAASQSLPVLMLAAFFGPAAAGFYTIAKMVMGMPTMLVGKAVNDVFYPRITEAARNGENLPRHITRATMALFAVSILPFGLVMLFGAWLFSFVFGDEWVRAGEYAQWLAVFFLFNFINKPSVAAVPALGIQQGLLVYEVFSTGGKVIGLAAGFYLFKSDLWAVALFSLSGTLTYIAMIIWIVYRAKLRLLDGKTG